MPGHLCALAATADQGADRGVSQEVARRHRRRDSADWAHLRDPTPRRCTVSLALAHPTGDLPDIAVPAASAHRDAMVPTRSQTREQDPTRRMEAARVARRQRSRLPLLTGSNSLSV